jgi:hypothetical protein
MSSASTFFFNLFFKISAAVVSEEIFKHLWKAEESLYKKMLPEHITNAPHLHYLRLYPYFEDFLHSIPKFGRLQILEMPRTEVGDICLKLIGTYCLDLRWNYHYLLIIEQS